MRCPRATRCYSLNGYGLLLRGGSLEFETNSWERDLEKATEAEVQQNGALQSKTVYITKAFSTNVLRSMRGECFSPDGGSFAYLSYYRSPYGKHVLYNEYVSITMIVSLF